MLELRGVTKRFGGLVAVEDVSLDVSAREIRGLIGPNGAGKSSLINIISGLLTPDAGEVRLNGVEVSGRGPEFTARAGIARTFQNLRLFPSLTVRQNIEVALSTARLVNRRRTKLLDVDAEIAEMGLANAMDREAGTLSYGDQRRVEVLRAAALCPYVMLLDEPAAGLNDTESLLLAGSIRSLRDRYGTAVIVIDHDLHFIMDLCEHITVLDMGQAIASGTASEIRRNPRVIEVYLGTAA